MVAAPHLKLEAARFTEQDGNRGAVLMVTRAPLAARATR
jgi:hypothetical protein